MEEIRILTIGNSLTKNATAFLRELARGAGKKMELFVAALEGYTLDQHVGHLKAYDSDSRDPVGRPYAGNSFGLREALQREDWDVVTIQQSSLGGMAAATFRPSVHILVDAIRHHVPRARILLFETWAYPDDCYAGLADRKLDRPAMREQVKAAYREISEETGLEIIPVGEAFERAVRSRPALKLTNPSDYHCNSHGQYLAGAVFHEVIYRDSVENTSFIPPEITEEEGRMLLRVAHQAIAATFSVPAHG